MIFRTVLSEDDGMLATFREETLGGESGRECFDGWRGSSEVDGVSGGRFGWLSSSLDSE